MLIKMKFEQFDQVYDLLQFSFPPDERRPYDEQKALLDEPAYQIYVWSEEGDTDVLAFVCVWRFDFFLFVEHFAVRPDARGNGLGSLILQKLKNMFPCQICLEVEPPETEFSQRRIQFYIRNGFYLNDFSYEQPPISKGKNPVPLMVMSSLGKLDETEFNLVKNKLYKSVYHIQ